MAKDAKGHGSEKRGGSTFDRLNAARKADGYAPMSEKQRGVHDFLDYMDGSGPMPDAMKAAGISDNQAADTLGQGHPKSQPVPVHPDAAGRKDMWGRTDADLKRDYGGPVRHFQKK